MLVRLLPHHLIIKLEDTYIHASMVQRCTIEPFLIDHLPHVNSIINSLTNSGDVSFLTSVEQIVQRHSSASKSDMGEETDIPQAKLSIT